MLGNLSPTFCVYEFAHSRCRVNVESYNVSHFAFGVFLLGTVFSGFMHVMASVRISLLSKPNIVLCVSATHMNPPQAYICSHLSEGKRPVNAREPIPTMGKTAFL